MEPSLLGSGLSGVPGRVGLGPTGLNMTAVNADTSSRQSADVKKHVSLQSTAKGALTTSRGQCRHVTANKTNRETSSTHIHEGFTLPHQFHVDSRSILAATLITTPFLPWTFFPFLLLLLVSLITSSKFPSLENSFLLKILS